MAKDQNSEAAKKVADAEKASKKKAGKGDRPNFFVRAAKAIAKFFKDLKGETKKIVWPTGKTVWKNTGIVLLVVLLVGVGIWLVDFGLSEGINAILGIEIGAEEETEAATQGTTQAAEIEVTEPATQMVTEAATQAVTEVETEAEIQTEEASSVAE